MTGTLWPWIGFNALILALLAIDLGVFHRKSHAVSVKEAAIWSVVWISLSLLFNAGIYFLRGAGPALEFFTGYLIEKSLSVDNIFIFVLIFSALKVPALYQHRVLFWGVIGALVMRGALILTGSALLENFHWVFYVFGAFLVFTGLRMAISREKEIAPEKNPALRLVRRLVPVTEDYVRDRFVVKQAGKLLVTPLLLTLVIVETTDLIFALDSIPAIFAVTQDPFIVYTSNVFAILGLRSLYFVFAGAMSQFHYLKFGLAVILVYVGVKMLVSDLFHVSEWISLLFIAVVLTLTVLASLLRTRRLNHAHQKEEEREKVGI